MKNLNLNETYKFEIELYLKILDSLNKEIKKGFRDPKKKKIKIKSWIPDSSFLFLLASSQTKKASGMTTTEGGCPDCDC